jgi:hypothetical protein
MGSRSTETDTAILKGYGAMITQLDFNVVGRRTASNDIIIGRVSWNDQVAGTNIMLLDRGIEHTRTQYKTQGHCHPQQLEARPYTGIVTEFFHLFPFFLLYC